MLSIAPTHDVFGDDMIIFDMLLDQSINLSQLLSCISVSLAASLPLLILRFLWSGGCMGGIQETVSFANQRYAVTQASLTPILLSDYY